MGKTIDSFVFLSIFVLMMNFKHIRNWWWQDATRVW